MKLVYAAGERSAPVRPLLRFWLGPEGYCDHIMPAAPLEGIATWIGRIPRGVTEVWISPVNRPGPFEFVVSEPARAPWRTLFCRLTRSPKRAFFALAAGWVGLEAEAALNWRWALGKSCRNDTGYATLRDATSRQPAVNEPTVRFVIGVDVRGASAREIDETCQSIKRQYFSNWRVCFLGQPRRPDGRPMPEFME